MMRHRSRWDTGSYELQSKRLQQGDQLADVAMLLLLLLRTLGSGCPSFLDDIGIGAPGMRGVVALSRFPEGHSLRDHDCYDLLLSQECGA